MAEISSIPVNIDRLMFKRRGAWFGLFRRAKPLGSEILFLGTCRGMSALAPDNNRLIDIFPTYEGEKLPYTIQVFPAELKLVTEHGNVRFTFADNSKILAEGDPAMGLLFEKTMVQHETVHPRADGAWEAFFRRTCAVIFKGLDGSSFNFNGGETPWNWEALSSGEIVGCTIPAPDKRFTLLIEEFTYGGIVRDSYPSYAEAKASMQSDWDAFIGTMPNFIPPFEKTRIECEYSLWSFLTSPSGAASYPMMQMFPGVMGSQWQMCQNAVALSNHTDLAVNLMLGPISRASPEGQLADMFDDSTEESLMVKPPVHGWAIKEIMKRHDLLKACSVEKLEKLYSGMGAWAEWFMKYRDEDRDGLPSVFHSDETGLDDCSLFVKHMCLTTPDISAYLVLLYEALGDLAVLLGKHEPEATEWYDKSSALLKLLIDELWYGGHFVGMVPATREKLLSDSILHYIPAILGKRLPKEIIDKLADELSDTNRFFGEWGLASEAFTSKHYSSEGFGKGCVIPPAMIFICTGLWETHRRDAARSFADKYCRALSNSGFPFFIDAKNGSGMYYGCSWSRCAYAILARMLSEEN